LGDKDYYSMPAIKINWNSNANGWGVWQIDESEEELSATVVLADNCPEEIANPRKRLEWLAGRSLLKKMVEESGLNYRGILKDEFGKPFLKDLNHQISLSNSFPFVAVQIHPEKSVGVDLEQPRPKLFQVMRRVLTDAEWNDGANNLRKLCVYWCAKEALYKIYGKRSLVFTEQILVSPFALGQSGKLQGIIRDEVGDKEISLNYLVYPEYILITTHVD
jgi:4'-phosphopantetheinyl transferase